MAKKTTTKNSNLAKGRTTTHGDSLPVDLSSLSRVELEDLFHTLEELDTRTRYNKLDYTFPEDGPLSRHAYHKHISFMNASKHYNELLLVGGNQIGKSFVAAYFAAMHISGIYPEWYQGKRLIGDILVWVCSLTAARVRDNMQTYLTGNISDIGSGFLPKKGFKEVKPKHGVPNGIDTITYSRADGGRAVLVFKSYDQGRRAFQGDRVDLIINDEEPEDAEIYSEQLIRTITTRGIMMTVFTPLRGLSKVVLRFLENGRFPAKNVPKHNEHIYIENVTWDDAPHLSEEDKSRIIKGLLPHEIEARTRGIPSVGTGRVYPLTEKEITVAPFPLPDHWPRVYGLDVGFVDETAGIFAALDIDTYGVDDPIVYIYNEYYAERMFPMDHASRLNKMGADWIPGVIDPSSHKGSAQKNNSSYFEQYRNLGLDLSNANNKVEEGIFTVTNLFTNKRLFIFNRCTNLLSEFSLYVYDSQGGIKRNQKDHALDALRYVIMSGLKKAIMRPSIADKYANDYTSPSDDGRSSRTGY